MPVDQYIGGIEHAVLHLLYARFFTKVLRDIGLVNVDEPFVNLLTQGMVCKETYRCESCGWLYPGEVENGTCTQCGKTAQVGRIEKMSKSTKNVIDPESLIGRYGADTARLFCLFAAPPERDLEWSEKGVEGSYRFLLRVWRIVMENRDMVTGAAPVDWQTCDDRDVKNLRRKIHQTVQKVSEDIDKRFHFNTAISAVMELMNQLYQFDGRKGNSPFRSAAFREAVEMTLQLLYPMVPHICEELWQQIGKNESISKSPWPVFDPDVVKADEIVIVIQVNGKLRGKITVDAQAPQEEIKEQALSCDQIEQWVAGKEVKKVIVVQGKLVNIVVK